jgi:hypothetical protein
MAAFLPYLYIVKIPLGVPRFPVKQNLYSVKITSYNLTHAKGRENRESKENAQRDARRSAAAGSQAPRRRGRAYPLSSRRAA